MTDDTPTPPPWARTFSLDEPGVLGLRVASFHFELERADHEWRYAHREEAGDWPETCEVLERVSDPVLLPDARPPPEGPTAGRFAFRQAPTAVTFSPRAAPRPVVVRPVVPVSVLPGDDVTLFVSTPMWLGVRVPERDEPIVEIPLYRPSDTWFGANTRDGELCFAAKTKARVELDPDEHLVQRIRTVARVRNRGETPITLDRLAIPVLYLSLYVDAKTRVWTDTLILSAESNSPMADVKVADGPPSFVGATTKVEGPRENRGAHFASRSFSALLRGWT